MNLDSFTGPGSTPSRRRFWDKVTQAVNASQKIAGSNVTCDEYQGYGTLINVPNPKRRPTPGGDTGACCIDGECTITTEVGCSGTFQGIGTVCDPNPCCTDCTGEFLFPPLNDGEGNCYKVENCDGFADPVACDTLWFTITQYCVGEDVDCSELCTITTVDPITCELTQTCFSNDCCATCVNGTVQSVSDQAFICPELSPPP